MAKLMSKSELIQKIVAQHSGQDGAQGRSKPSSRSLAAIGYKELSKSGAFVVPGFCQICCYQEAGNKGTEWH